MNVLGTSGLYVEPVNHIVGSSYHTRLYSKHSTMSEFNITIELYDKAGKLRTFLNTTAQHVDTSA